MIKGRYSSQNKMWKKNEKLYIDSSLSNLQVFLWMYLIKVILIQFSYWSPCICFSKWDRRLGLRPYLSEKKAIVVWLFSLVNYIYKGNLIWSQHFSKPRFCFEVWPGNSQLNLSGVRSFYLLESPFQFFYFCFVF